MAGLKAIEFSLQVDTESYQRLLGSYLNVVQVLESLAVEFEFDENLQSKINDVKGKVADSMRDAKLAVAEDSKQ